MGLNRTILYKTYSIDYVPHTSGAEPKTDGVKRDDRGLNLFVNDCQSFKGLAVMNIAVTGLTHYQTIVLNLESTIHQVNEQVTLNNSLR